MAMSLAQEIREAIGQHTPWNEPSPGYSKITSGPVAHTGPKVQGEKSGGMKKVHMFLFVC